MPSPLLLMPILGAELVGLTLAYLWRVGGIVLVRARAGYVLQLAAIVAVVGIIVMAVDQALDPDVALVIGLIVAAVDLPIVLAMRRRRIAREAAMLPVDRRFARQFRMIVFITLLGTTLLFTFLPWVLR